MGEKYSSEGAISKLQPKYLWVKDIQFRRRHSKRFKVQIPTNFTIHPSHVQSKKTSTKRSSIHQKHENDQWFCCTNLRPKTHVNYTVKYTTWEKKEIFCPSTSAASKPRSEHEQPGTIYSQKELKHPSALPGQWMPCVKTGSDLRG